MSSINECRDVGLLISIAVFFQVGPGSNSEPEPWYLELEHPLVMEIRRCKVSRHHSQLQYVVECSCNIFWLKCLKCVLAIEER